MEYETKPKIHIEHMKDLEFKVKFDWEGVANLIMDEPEPFGSQRGPNGARVVAAAVGSCLSASLMFCFQKSRVKTSFLKAVTIPELKMNEKGMWRIVHIEVKIVTDAESSRMSRIKRCMEIFEEFCIVTASIRKGIPVDVEITNRDGKPLLKN